LSTRGTYIPRYGEAANYEVAERFVAYAGQADIHPVTLAVAWVKANPAITAPILGARNLGQLAPSLAAADLDLTAEQWSEIAALTPPVPIATDRTEERDA
jgi:aryl-alcohol dehydrogenase-like predicted oxidoreductase